MRVDIYGQDLRVGQRLADVVERHLRFALDRFDRVVEHVSVRLGRRNGPYEGEDKHCRLVAGMGRLGQVVIDEFDAELPAAIGRASDRLARSVGRVLARRRSKKGRGNHRGQAAA